MGQVAVLDDLNVVVEVFESTEGHLAAIDATAARIERRIANTARYMDRVGRTSEASIMEAMKSVARQPSDFSVRSSAVLTREVPIGPSHMAIPRREKPAIEATEVRAQVKDQAYERFLSAKTEYLRRVKVTPSSMEAFLERTIAANDSVRGSEMTIADVDDFLSFQRLRELQTIFGGSLARKYEISMLSARIQTDWIECQDFVVSRKRSGNRA